MGYRSDVRIVTSKEGFEKLKEFVAEYLKEHNEDYNLLDECDIKEEGKNQCYLGWDSIKWYEDSYDDVDAVMNGLRSLRENNYSYRFMRIGESYDDIEELCYNGDKDREYDVEYPNMIREFDDEYVLSLISENKSQELEESKDEVDI